MDAIGYPSLEDNKYNKLEKSPTRAIFSLLGTHILQYHTITTLGYTFNKDDVEILTRIAWYY